MNINNLSQRFQIYLNQNFSLANTLIVKSSMMASTINDYILETYGVAASSDPTQWKYYQNLAGQYTSYDTPMNIISLDTGNTILFSPETLAANPITLENYQYGTFFYNQLVNQYPNQAALIQSIVYPVNINTAISANDGSILNYQTSLVEPQEYTLIRDLQTWIYNYTSRWNVSAYSLSDSLYPAAFYGVMFSNIVPKILNLRLLRCKTIEAHSFHIREYLNSNNNLGQYIEYLTLGQQLYLYRNLHRFRNYSGFTEVFKELITNLANPNGIIINGVYLTKTTQYGNSNPNIPYSDFTLEPLFTTQTNAISTKMTKSTLLGYEEPLNFNNTYEINTFGNLINDQLTCTLDSSYNTKDLITTNVNITVPYTFTIHDVMYSNFVYTTIIGNYNAVVLTQMNNGDYVYMSATQAMYLMLYVASKMYNINLTTYPELSISKALNATIPTLAQTEAMFSSSIYNIEGVYNNIVNMIPTAPNINNVNVFNAYATNIYNAMVKFYLYTASRSGIMERGYYENLFLSFFTDYSIPANPSQSFSNLLNSLNISYVANYSNTELTSLFINLFKGATGYTIGTSTDYINTINAIIGIITNLSSYTVRVINNTTDSIVSLNTVAVRSSGFLTTNLSEDFINLFNVLGEDVSNSNLSQLNMNRLTTQFNNNYSYGLNGNDSIGLNNNFYDLTETQIQSVATYYMG